MHYFFDDQPLADILDIGGEEGRHAFVLRIKPGEKVGILNGQGRIITAEAIEVHKQSIKLKIIDYKIVPVVHPLLHIAISPTRQVDRFEWLLEKATEFGVHAITPLICDHTDRINYKYDRWQKILISGLKQSGRPYLPMLHQALEFAAFIQVPHQSPPCIAHHSGDPISQVDLKDKEDIIICIGPEGDFSAQELNQAKMHHLSFVSFGQYRLRTETAGLMAAAYFSH